MDKTAEVLARLREEKARLAGELAGVERAIAAIEAALEALPPAAVEVPAPLPPPVELPPPPPPPPPGPYADLGFYEAAALYLRESGEPKTSREIADALLAGGFPTTAANFRASARTMLARYLTAKTFGIHLTEDRMRWYAPASAPDA